MLLPTACRSGNPARPDKWNRTEIDACIQARGLSPSAQHRAVVVRDVSRADAVPVWVSCGRPASGSHRRPCPAVDFRHFAVAGWPARQAFLFHAERPLDDATRHQAPVALIGHPRPARFAPASTRSLPSPTGYSVRAVPRPGARMLFPSILIELSSNGVVRRWKQPCASSSKNRQVLHRHLPQRWRARMKHVQKGYVERPGCASPDSPDSPVSGQSRQRFLLQIGAHSILLVR